jgi:hypothetical protein
MKVLLYVVALILYTSIRLAAQTEFETDIRNKITTYYNLGVKYKDGVGVPTDFEMAFYNFSKAASLGDEQSIYAQAYFYFKGLGCNQDYIKAAQMFSRGARLQRDNSMYFYALCFRNGYGIERNEDSAKYWLTKSADLGYKQAAQELSMKTAENSNTEAQVLVEKIHFAAIPKEHLLNQFTKFQHIQPIKDLLDGKFQGYVIQYDWSGKNVIDSRKLTLDLKVNSNTISGIWNEEASRELPFMASISKDSIIFYNTKILRKDHYSADTLLSYEFKNIKLNSFQSSDSVYLIGNTEMFSNLRKEPSKPITVVLSKFQPKNNENIKKSTKVFPNPFTDFTNVEFELLGKENVEIQVVNINGAILISRNSGLLDKGNYAIKLKLSDLVPGSYFIKIKQGLISESYPIIKR